jgi:TonB family protein
MRRPPEYPPEALRLELTGRSLLVFTVTAEGSIEKTGLFRSSGFTLLDQASVAHLDKCVAAFMAAAQPKLPSGTYILPILWRIE